MSLRFGTGPLYKVELVAAGRRWQTFALRGALVAILLAFLSLSYWSDWRIRNGTSLSIQEYAGLAESFASTVLITQLSIMLLAAPAATAGAVCLDKARGNLTLLLVTDLSSAELINGKLAGRLTPVLYLVAASIPVLFIVGLMGGVGWELLAGGFVVIVGAATVTAALAFHFSVWVGRTQDALMLADFAIITWLLAYPMGHLTGPPFLTGHTSAMLNPFALLSAPTSENWGLTIADYYVYTAATFGTALLLILIAIWRLRAAVLTQSNRQAAPSRFGHLFRRKQSSRLLDRTPLRWYESHRRRPTRTGRLIGCLFFACVVVATVWTMYESYFGSHFVELPVILIGFFVGFQMLFIVLASVTSLADERSRGNLDILLATPVSTKEVVATKWRSAFRMVRSLLFLPMFIAIWIMAHRYRQGFSIEPFVFMLLMMHLLASGAFYTSLGLMLATRVRSFSRAIGVAVSIYVAMAIAWPILLEMFSVGENTVAILLLPASTPVGCAAAMNVLVTGSTNDNDMLLVVGVAVWTLIYAVAAGVLYFITLRNFNRCMGRISERPARVQRKPTQRRRGLGVEVVEPRGMP